MQKVAELLGLKPENVTEKCDKYGQQYIMQTLQAPPGDDGMDRRKTSIEFVKNNFSKEEMIFMCINWLDEKTTEAMQKTLANLKNSPPNGSGV
jgi:hypothetical protein